MPLIVHKDGIFLAFSFLFIDNPSQILDNSGLYR